MNGTLPLAPLTAQRSRVLLLAATLAICLHASVALGQWGAEERISTTAGDVWRYAIAASSSVVHVIWGSNPIY